MSTVKKSANMELFDIRKYVAEVVSVPPPILCQTELVLSFTADLIDGHAWIEGAVGATRVQQALRDAKI